MSWQDQGGSPWGSKGAPDLKKLFEKINKFIPLSYFGGGKYGVIPYVIGGLVIVWLLSGIYFVKPDEV
ncbi:MAG: protease modulator HflK N-terminal domain-containing protein, partial [Syntrophales bacterium]|nr:protease modulator HflK N-terminal domain-containing protein [Syntrophales bacterium]